MEWKVKTLKGIKETILGRRTAVKDRRFKMGKREKEEEGVLTK